MISLIFSVMVLMFSFKYLVFISNFFLIDCNIFFLLTIFPLVFFLLSKILFNFSSLEMKVSYTFIFFMIFLSLSLCFCSDFSLFFLLFLELSSFFMILFIFNFSKDHDKVSSSCFMFFTNIFGSIPFMFFCVMTESSLSFFLHSYSFFSSMFIMLCFVLILFSKLPLVMVHFWLTKAHVSSSGSGSMLLASVMLKIGSFGLFKFSPMFLSFNFLSLKNFLFLFGVITSLFLSVVMNRFFDIKYVVACSSISHMALVSPMILNFSPIGVFSSMLMMIGHGVVSCFIFFLITLLYELSYSRSMDLNKGIESSSKSLNLFFFLFFLMSMGFPPFIGFMSELLFFCSIIGFSFILSVMFFINMIMVGKVFMVIVLSSIFGKKNSFIDGELGAMVSFYSMVFFIFLFLSLYNYF